jgi:hypothetical protein
MLDDLADTTEFLLDASKRLQIGGDLRREVLEL